MSALFAFIRVAIQTAYNPDNHWILPTRDASDGIATKRMASHGIAPRTGLQPQWIAPHRIEATGDYTYRATHPTGGCNCQAANS